MNATTMNNNNNSNNGNPSPRTHPPAHLPVLTEVVQFKASVFSLDAGAEIETEPAALMLTAAKADPAPDDVFPVAVNEAAAGVDLPLVIEDRPVPHWLLRRDDSDAPAAAAPSAMPWLTIDSPPAGAQGQGLPSPDREPTGDVAPVPAWLAEASEAGPAPQPVATAPTPAPDHVIPDRRPFTTSWWMSQEINPAEAPAVGAPAGQAQAPAVQPPTPVSQPSGVTEDQLVLRVMTDLDRQVGMMFEHRMHEVIVPAFARATDALLKELREELSVSLRDMVIRAVAVELARHTRGDK